MVAGASLSIFTSKFSDITSKNWMVIILVNTTIDSLVWINSIHSNLTAKLAYSHLDSHVNPLPLCKTVWAKTIPPSRYFI